MPKNAKHVLGSFLILISFVGYLLPFAAAGTEPDRATVPKVRSIAVLEGTPPVMVVAGEFKGYQGKSSANIVRFGEDGEFDKGFAVGAGFDGPVNEIMANSSTGKVTAVGNFSHFDGSSVNNIARVNPDGAIDTSFAAGSGFGGGTPERIVSSNDGSGAVYVIGSFTSYNGKKAVHIVRLTSDGDFDSSFKTGQGFDGNPYTLVLDPTDKNKIIVGGSFTDYDGKPAQNILRLNADGTVDKTFVSENAFDGQVVKILPVPGSSGGFYVTGLFRTFQGNAVGQLVKLDRAGNLDKSFTPSSSTTGKTLFQATTSGDWLLTYSPYAWVLEQKPDGSFQWVLKGGMLRMLSSGATDKTFAGPTNLDGELLAMAEMNGKTYLGGSFSKYGTTQVNGLARVDSTGALDIYFNLGTSFY